MKSENYDRHVQYCKIAERHEPWMLDKLIEWSEINTGTYNMIGLDRMLDRLISDFSITEGETEIIQIPSSKEYHGGKILRIRKFRPGKIKVLLVCHMDTVYAPDHTFQKCSQSGHNLIGPGVADAKGGILLILESLRLFEESPFASELSWEVLINQDEEIGSPGSNQIIALSGRSNDLGFVYEPAFPDGSLVSFRKGSGNFAAAAFGRAAHAGRDPERGRNAITALAKFIMELDKLNRNGITLNVGYIKGGGPVNIVPDEALCRFNIRVLTDEEQQGAESHISKTAEMINEMDGISINVQGAFRRPPKPLTSRVRWLLEFIQDCGRKLNLNLTHRMSGGACDGNNLHAAGLTVIDSMGVVGGKLHSAEEYVYLPSLVERAQLSAFILMRLACTAHGDTISELLPRGLGVNNA